MWLYHRVMSQNDADGMANSVDPDQTAPLGAVWSGSALFAQAYLSENLGTVRYVFYFCNFCEDFVFMKTICCKNSVYILLLVLWDQHEYCKMLYFRVFFILRFCDIKPFRGNLNSWCLMLSYVNIIYSNISWECWIHETSNSQILVKIKFSRIIASLQYSEKSEINDWFRLIF